MSVDVMFSMASLPTAAAAILLSDLECWNSLRQDPNVISVFPFSHLPDFVPYSHMQFHTLHSKLCVHKSTVFCFPLLTTACGMHKQQGSLQPSTEIQAVRKHFQAFETHINVSPAEIYEAGWQRCSSRLGHSATTEAFRGGGWW